jgi:biotin carboxylase
MAHLLIIDLPGGNDVDLPLAALAGGHSFSFLSADLAHYQRQSAVMAVLARAHTCLGIPGFDMAEVQAQVLALHARQPIDAVLCLVDIRLVEAAQLAACLATPHIRPATATLLRDKFLVRQRLAQAGITQPDFALARSNAELRQAVEQLGLPVLIKPADGYGSQNIVALQHEEDLDPLLSPLDDMLPSRTDYGLGVRANDRLLVERLMHGQFIGCDTLSLAGQHQLLGVNHKLMFEPPSFAIRGGGYTPNGPEFAALERYVFEVLDAVGFDTGATHMEIMLTTDGPRVVEINPRLVGAKIGRLINLALGRSVHADLIDTHLGRLPVPSAPGTRPQAAATRWIVAEHDGVLSHLAQPTAAPGIASVEVLKTAGDTVRRPLDNADRIACVMACAATAEAAAALAEAHVAGTRVVMRDEMPLSHASAAAQALALAAA